MKPVDSVDTNPEPTGRPLSLSDKENNLISLLTRIANNDEQALGVLYDLTSPHVYGLALKICRDERLAEEVASDVFVQIWQQAGRFNSSRGKVTTWMLTICRTRSIDAIRRVSRKPTTDNPAKESEELANQELANQEGPLNVLHAVEQKTLVHGALSSLSPNQQQLLSLAFFKGLSHQQIADFENMPLGTVKTQLRNALKQLKNFLGHKDASRVETML
jgi:RNA polymerase sigma factor (sigma-70 family)